MASQELSILLQREGRSLTPCYNSGPTGTAQVSLLLANALTANQTSKSVATAVAVAVATTTSNTPKTSLARSLKNQFGSAARSASPLTANLVMTTQENLKFKQLWQLQDFFHQQKQQQQHNNNNENNNNKRPLSELPSTIEKPASIGSSSADTLEIVHKAVHQIESSELLHSFAQQRSSKRAKKEKKNTPAPPKTNKTSSPLHEACRRGPNLTIDEVEAILAKDPEAARRSVVLPRKRQVYNPVAQQLQEKEVQEPFKYALNLAIYYQASTAVLERLMLAAPKVLSLRDKNSCSIHILMRYKPKDAASADSLMLTAPETVHWKDQKNNSALHIAVQYGAPLATIRHLVALNPDALDLRNFHQHTPLNLAQKHIINCPPHVSDYLTVQLLQKVGV